MSLAAMLTAKGVRKISGMTLAYMDPLGVWIRKELKREFIGEKLVHRINSTAGAVQCDCPSHTFTKTFDMF